MVRGRDLRLWPTLACRLLYGGPERTNPQMEPDPMRHASHVTNMHALAILAVCLLTLFLLGGL